MISEWLKDPHNRELYYEWLAEWERQNPQFLPDPTPKLEAYVAHMLAHPNDRQEVADEMIMPPSAPKTTWKAWLGVAAVLALLTLFGAQYREELWYRSYHTAYNDIRTLTLDDGTRVVMNSNTTLLIPRFKFRFMDRHVVLRGEANFAVTHGPNDEKFIVKTDNDLKVVVLGTEFTVNSRRRGDKVLLNKGSIQLEYLQEKEVKKLLMTPGDLLTRSQDGHIEKRKTNIHQNYTDWINNRFTFDGTSLQELNHMFQDNYGIFLKFEGKELHNFSLYGSYRAKSAEELILALTKSANLQYSQNQDTITIIQP